MQGSLPNLTALLDNLRDVAASRAQDAAAIVASAAPVKTGAYQAAVADGGETEATGDGVILRVSGPAPLTGWIREGTPPHLILPVNTKALRFETSGGGIVYARAVNHPGHAPNQFEQQVADTLADLARDIAIEAVARTVGG